MFFFWTDAFANYEREGSPAGFKGAAWQTPDPLKSCGAPLSFIIGECVRPEKKHMFLPNPPVRPIGSRLHPCKPPYIILARARRLPCRTPKHRARSLRGEGGTNSGIMVLRPCVPLFAVVARRCPLKFSCTSGDAPQEIKESPSQPKGAPREPKGALGSFKV